MSRNKICGFTSSFVSEVCLGWIFAGYWSVIVSFFQANMWHFTEPYTSGITLFPLVIFGVCILMPTIFVLVPIQVIRSSTTSPKPTSIAFKIVYVIPLILLLICELPVADLWARTSCLTVALIILQICCFYPSQFHGNLRQSSSTTCAVATVNSCTHKPDNRSDELSDSHTNNNCHCSSQTSNNIKQMPEKIVCKDALLGMLIVLSVRWAYLSINVFFESWVSGVIILCCALLYEFSNHISRILHKCINIFMDEENQTQTPPMMDLVVKQKTRKPSSLTQFITAILMANGMASLLQMCVWTIASPAFFCRWCGISLYPTGIVVPLSFLVGILLVMLINTSCTEMLETQKQPIVKEVVAVLIPVVMLIIGFSLVLYVKTIAGAMLICISLPSIIHHHVTTSAKLIDKSNNFTTLKCAAALKSLSVFIFNAMVCLYWIIYISFQSPKYLSSFQARYDIIIWMQISSIVAAVIFTSLIPFAKRCFGRNDQTQSTSVDGPKLTNKPISKTTILDVIVPVVVSLVVFAIGIGGYIQLMRHRCEWVGINDGQVKVLTWNILLGHDMTGRNNLGPLSDVIKQEQPDVVGLQEADPWHAQWGGKDTWSYLRATLGDCYHQFPGSHPAESLLGIGLLSRNDVVSHSDHILPTDLQANVPNYGFNKLTLEMKRNASPVHLHVYTLHALYKNWTCPNSKPLSVLSCQQMHAVADDLDTLPPTDPVIVMGDFNINPREPELDLWFDEEFGFKSALIQYTRNRDINYRFLLSRNSSCFDINKIYANFTKCNPNDHYQDSTIHNRHAHVDHIFYRGLKLINSSILNINNFSDHKPLMAKFSL